MNVDPNSSDAWFARLDQRLTNQDAALDRIETQAKKTNGRVSSLEKWRWAMAGGMTVIITLIGWYVVWNPRH